MKSFFKKRKTDLINKLNLQKQPALLVCYCWPVNLPLAREEISPRQKELEVVKITSGYSCTHLSCNVMVIRSHV